MKFLNVKQMYIPLLSCISTTMHYICHLIYITLTEHQMLVVIIFELIVNMFENIIFILKLCAAFDLCIALMNKGEVCEIMTEARFAYGETGR
jgi:hypothetical protein